MPLDQTYLERLKLWAAAAAAILALSAAQALMARWFGETPKIEFPPLPPMTFVVSPGPPGSETTTVKVIPGGAQP